MATEALEKIAELGNVKFLELGSLVIKERNGTTFIQLSVNQ